MKIIDLTLPIFSGMQVYPGDPEVKVELVHTYAQETWELRQLTLGSHTGTHVDAFSHMHEGASSIDEIPLDRFIGKSQVVPLEAMWPSGKGLFFIEEIGMDHFDKLMQSMPPFVGGPITEQLERALLQHHILTFTNLVNLELLPYEVDFMFFGLPLKLVKGDGSPVRAIAIFEEGKI